jgi:cellulose synthase/poly-beta-1,6-N-acetylglucosamine synthase-like glycosyltransferase
MLSQDKGLRTLFEPAAVSETVAPQSLRHYLSQRRRWGSNAYFNNYYYLFGEKMIAWTRAAAFIEVLRLTMVYYRVVNTAMFIRGMVTSFAFMEIMPLLIVAEIPLVWFIFYTLVLNKMLRRRSGKLALGWFINKFMSCFISVTVFSLVARNLGLQVWGMSGVTASSATATTTAGTTIDEKADSAEPFNAAERLEKAEGMDRMDRAPSIL